METFLCRGWTARSRSTIQNRFLQTFALSLHRATSARPDVFTVPPQIMSSAIRYNTSQLHNTLPRLCEISNRGVIPFRYEIIHQDHPASMSRTFQSYSIASIEVEYYFSHQFRGHTTRLHLPGKCEGFPFIFSNISIGSSRLMCSPNSSSINQLNFIWIVISVTGRYKERHLH
jgi:hypothetical protein